MSKKNKSKFKKILKAQIAQKINQAQSSESKTVPKEKAAFPQNSLSVESNVASQSESSIALNSGDINLTQVKADLIKTAIIVLILLLIIAVLYYLNYKNNILLVFGNWLFEVLNIQ